MTFEMAVWRAVTPVVVGGEAEFPIRAVGVHNRHVLFGGVVVAKAFQAAV